MDAFRRTIPRLMEALGSSVEAREAFIFAAWRTTAGRGVNECAVPVSIDDARLVVAVENKAWQRNLQDLAGQFLFSLNSVLGSSMVKFIEFRVDPVFVKQRLPLPEPARHDADLGELPKRVIESAAGIEDETLRNAFLKAAANCLARPDQNCE